MIILDTNVLSEILRPHPDAKVMAWLDVQSVSSLFTTTVTRGEIFYGVLLMPKGRRRDRLHDAVTAIFSEDFSGRTLVFDDAAADAFASIASARKKIGKPIRHFDAMIAAVTYSRGAKLATRNARLCRMRHQNYRPLDGKSSLI